jgi:solute carrier family 25 (mitochondrial carnitine/acylcarnitine transporter), member 20/29
MFLSHAAAFTKVLDCVRQSFRYNGVKGPFQVSSKLQLVSVGRRDECRSHMYMPHACVLWIQGLSATLVRNVPANSVYLGSFEVMKREVAKRQDIPVTQLHPGLISSPTQCATACTRAAPLHTRLDMYA